LRLTQDAGERIVDFVSHARHHFRDLIQLRFIRRDASA
jgi:hypothetical protein